MVTSLSEWTTAPISRSPSAVPSGLSMVMCWSSTISFFSKDLNSGEPGAAAARPKGQAISSAPMSKSASKVWNMIRPRRTTNIRFS